jgi:hypothetical protein
MMSTNSQEAQMNEKDHHEAIKKAEDRLANRLQGATSIAAADAALLDHKWALKRIDRQYPAS